MLPAGGAEHTAYSIQPHKYFSNHQAEWAAWPCSEISNSFLPGQTPTTSGLLLDVGVGLILLNIWQVFPQTRSVCLKINWSADLTVSQLKLSVRGIIRTKRRETLDSYLASRKYFSTLNNTGGMKLILMQMMKILRSWRMLRNVTRP